MRSLRLVSRVNLGELIFYNNVILKVHDMLLECRIDLIKTNKSVLYLLACFNFICSVNQYY